jgi:hypothetical protein
MFPLAVLAISCVSGFAVAGSNDRLRLPRCPECERLESEFLDARDRVRTLRRLRRLTPVEEKQLLDRVAMAIARIKEHEARHPCEHGEKRIAAK